MSHRRSRLHGNSLVVRRVSPGRIIVVLFWTKYAVPRQIKPGVLKLTTSGGRRNLCTVFIFVSCKEKDCYRIVSLGHQNFDSRSHCRLSHRMQGVGVFQNRGLGGTRGAAARSFAYGCLNGLGGKRGAGVPGYGVPGCGKRGVWWKTRGLMENAGTTFFRQHMNFLR